MKTSPFCALALAKAVTAAPALLQRQSHSETWNDPFIPEPINFSIRNAGAQCDFQLVYERFSVDNRYDIDYVAEYGDGSQWETSSSHQCRRELTILRTKLSTISGTLSRDNIWLVDGLEESRALQVAFFSDACQSGSAPTSFRVNARLRDGFTYEKWVSNPDNCFTIRLTFAQRLDQRQLSHHCG